MQGFCSGIDHDVTKKWQPHQHQARTTGVRRKTTTSKEENEEAEG